MLITVLEIPQFDPAIANLSIWKQKNWRNVFLGTSFSTISYFPSLEMSQHSKRCPVEAK